MEKEEQKRLRAVLVAIDNGTFVGNLLRLPNVVVGTCCENKSSPKHRKEVPDVYPNPSSPLFWRNETAEYLGPPKTELSIRTFPVGTQVRECVSKLIACQERLLGYSVSQCPYRGSENFLFVSPLLRPYNPKTFDAHFKDFLKECGITGVGVHATRHSFIANMVQKFPEELPSISEIVGHSDKATALGYSHGSDQRKQSLMDSF